MITLSSGVWGLVSVGHFTFTIRGKWSDSDLGNILKESISNPTKLESPFNYSLCPKVFLVRLTLCNIRQALRLMYLVCLGISSSLGLSIRLTGWRRLWSSCFLLLILRTASFDWKPRIVKKHQGWHRLLLPDCSFPGTHYWNPGCIASSDCNTFGWPWQPSL